MTYRDATTVHVCSVNFRDMEKGCGKPAMALCQYCYSSFCTQHLYEHECEVRNIAKPAEELGKSIAKVLMSEKYDKYTVQECIGIANMALPIITEILLQSEKDQEEEK